MSNPTVYYNTASEMASYKSKWWDTPEDETYRHVWAVIKKIMEGQKYREMANLRFARLYHNMELMSLRAGGFARVSVSGQDNIMANKVTLNVIKSCVDTAASKIGKMRPRPLFLTQDGEWGDSQRAKHLTQYCEGWFDEESVYQKGARTFVDAAVFGTGVLKLYTEGEEIKVERIISNELIVDDIEGRYENPRQMHQVKLMFRELLLEMFPDYKQEIMSAQSGLSAQEQAFCSADMINVSESWHLKSGEDAKDGLHTICIENATLFRERYNKDYFPFVFLRWTPKLLGFYGMGLAEELIGIQLEINKILRNIQIAQHLSAVPQVWLDVQSKIIASHINNEIGGIKYYADKPPIFMTPGAMNPEIYQHLERLYEKAYQITGISQMSANSQKPAGLTAAVAMRELSDIESDRFMLISQRYEQMFMDIAKMAIDMTKDAYEQYPTMKIKAQDNKFMRQIKWKDVDLDDECYTMRVYPTSLLPSQPAGKLQKVQELMQAGFFSKEEAMNLLDYPDVEKVTKRITAPYDVVVKAMDSMIDKGEYITPEPFQNLQLAMQLAQTTYVEAKVKDVPPDRLELILRYMEDVRMLLQPPPPPPQQMPMPGQAPSGAPQDAMAPIATPQAQPQSELLPVAPQQGAVQ